MALSPEQIAQLRSQAGLSATPPIVGSDDVIAQRKARLGITETPTDNNFGENGKIVGGVVGKFIDRAKPVVEQAGQTVQRAISGEGEFAGQNPITRGFEAAGTAASAIPSVAVEALPESDNFHLRSTVKEISQIPSKIVNWLGEKIGSTEAAQKFVEQHPDAANTLAQVAGILSSSGDISNTILGAEGVSRGITKSSSAPGKVMEVGSEIKNKFTTSPEGKATMQAGEELKQISDMIAPKPTIRQARLAQEQGRLVKGESIKKPGLFTEGSGDKVLPSSQQAKSTFTVKKYIPDAANLDPASLTTEIKTSIENIATKLKPEMQKVAIKPEVMDKMGGEWKALKQSQMEDAFSVLDEKAVARMQKDFEARLGKIKDGTIDDIWQARQAYDDAIPPNVKTANEQSSDVLQAQKEIWLDNRKIFSDALVDAENGLGATARQAFSDMRDLYEAKNGLLSKAKIDTASRPSGIKKFMDTHPKTKAVLQGAGALEVGRRMLTGGF